MRNTTLWLIFLSLILIFSSSAVLAAKSSGAELTCSRWAVYNDAISGINSLRMVIDVSGPVEVVGSIVGQSSSRILVNVKGAVPGKSISNMQLDGKIASRATFLKKDKDTQITFDLPFAVDNNGYKVFTLPSDPANKKPCRVVLDIFKAVPPTVINFKPGLRGKVITLDPGHGGSDCGAVGANKTYEKTVTLAISRNVKTLLENAGAKVLMTHVEDVDVFAANSSATDELNARVAVANNARADLLLSIHTNAFSDRAVGGTGTYYYEKTKYDAMFAQSIQNGLIEAIALDNRGVRTANFVVVKKTAMPAALVELAFISNINEEKMLNNPDTQQQIAQGIVKGMENFFNQAAKQGGGGY